MKKEKEHRFMSTVTSMTKHMNSFEHKDIEYEVNGMIEDSAMAMESLNDIYEMCRFQGRIQALRAVLDIPRNIIESLEEQSVRDQIEHEEGE